MSNREHLDWLMEQAAASAEKYLDLWRQLRNLDPESDEHSTVEADIMAWLAQVEMDASDVLTEHDSWLDTLPDDEEDEEVRA